MPLSISRSPRLFQILLVDRRNKFIPQDILKNDAGIRICPGKPDTCYDLGFLGLAVRVFLDSFHEVLYALISFTGRGSYPLKLIALIVLYGAVFIANSVRGLRPAMFTGDQIFS